MPAAIHGEDNMKELCGVNDMAGLQPGHPAQFSQQLAGERQPGKKRERLAACVMSAVLRCTQGKQLIDCTTENKTRHDEAACSLCSCQPLVLFSCVNESKGFSKRIDLGMAGKLMGDSGKDESAGEPPHSLTACNPA